MAVGVDSILSVCQVKSDPAYYREGKCVCFVFSVTYVVRSKSDNVPAGKYAHCSVQGSPSKSAFMGKSKKAFSRRGPIRILLSTTWTLRGSLSKLIKYYKVVQGLVRQVGKWTIHRLTTKYWSWCTMCAVNWSWNICLSIRCSLSSKVPNTLQSLRRCVYHTDRTRL